MLEFKCLLLLLLHRLLLLTLQHMPLDLKRWRLGCR